MKPSRATSRRNATRPTPGAPPVLCGTDFSVHAAEAADIAGAIARRSGAPLLLIHAVDQPVVRTGSPEDHPELLGRNPEKLAAETDRLRAAGTDVRPSIIAGSPHQGVAEAAASHAAGLIVVGSIGQIAPSRLLVGSVAERTAETAPAPTLVVREPTALRDWAAGRRRLRVVIAHDFSTTADQAVAWAAGLAKLGPCDLTVAHIDWLPGEVHRLGLPGPIPLTKNPPLVAHVLERDLRERIAPLLNGQTAALHVSPGLGRTAEHLIEIARLKEADLLVVGTHQRHGLSRIHLGSVSRGILRHAPMNVAVIPLPESAPSTQVIQPFQRALVPTDFSPLANTAIAAACSVLPRGGTLHLLHVRPAAPAGKRAAQGTAPRTHESRARQLARLRALIPAATSTLGLSAEVHVAEHDHVAKAICQEAERTGANVICIASHGRSGLSRALLGSVAHEVMQLSPRPVLVVRPQKS